MKNKKRMFGVCKDKIELPDDFNETPQDIIDSFYSTDKRLEEAIKDLGKWEIKNKTKPTVESRRGRDSRC